MDLIEIRRLVIISLFSDDTLMEQLVLKGGNALNIIYSIGDRSSVDVDLSIAKDFADVEDVKRRVFGALKNRFDAAGFVVFDEKFGARPENPPEGLSEVWGGYAVEFKVTRKETHKNFENNLEKLRRTAIPVSPNNSTKFKIEISKHEFVEPKEEKELDHFTIYVYSLPMIVIEKIRAICQQLPEYELRAHPAPRGRDFYDIYSILQAQDIDLTATENLELIRSIFAAKEVPLEFMRRIESLREFHRQNWEAVIVSVSEELEPFDFYFDFVLGLIKKLQTVGII